MVSGSVCPTKLYTMGTMTISRKGIKAFKGSSEPGGPRKQLRRSKNQLAGYRSQMKGPQRHMMRAQGQLRASEAAKIASKAVGKALEPAERT